MIECCRVIHIGIEYKIKISKDFKSVLDYEFVEKSNCKHCQALLIRFLNGKNKGESLEDKVFRGKKAEKIMKHITVLSPRYKDKLVEKRWSLPYSDKNVVKQCYSNISSMKIGRIDLDPYKV